MKILCVLPRFNKADLAYYDPNSTDKFYNYIMPAGIAYVSSALKHAGFEVDVQNQNHVEGLIYDVIKKQLQLKHYDYVFTGGLSMYYPNIRDLVIYIREISPSTVIVVGGGIISAQPKIMFELLKPDVGVMFEGEETCVELVRCFEAGGELSQVKGIVYTSKDKETIINAMRPPIENLDMIPYPDYEGLGIVDYIENTKPFHLGHSSTDWVNSYSIVTSRSCPYKCTFCFHSTGNKYRQRSIENIMGEIQWAIPKYKINYLFFLDELFAFDKQRALELCRQLKEFVATVPWHMRMYFQLRVDRTDVEIIDALKDIGADIVFAVGLESFNLTVLQSMKKQITPYQIKKCIALIADRHMMIQGMFIFGDPAETLETAKETLDFLKSHQDIIRGGIDCAFIIPFAGTGVYQHCVDAGIIKDEIALINERAERGYNKFNPMNMTSLSDLDFKKLQDMVWSAEYLAPRYTYPISSDVVHHVPQVSALCPYCNRPTIIKNMVMPPTRFWNGRCICQHEDCLGRFLLVTRWYIVSRWFVQIFGYGKAQKALNILRGYL